MGNNGSHPLTPEISPILGQEKGPEDQKDPGTGAQSS